MSCRSVLILDLTRFDRRNPVNRREKIAFFFLSLSLSISYSLSLRFGLEQKMRSFGGLDFFRLFIYETRGSRRATCHVSFGFFFPEIIYFVLVSIPFILNGNSLNI